MINTSTLKRLACMSAITAAFVLVSGSFSEINAQRDPFKKAGWATPKAPAGPATPKAPGSAPAPSPASLYGPPDIEARIEYYKRLRETAASQGTPIPKVTSVLTLNEMAVTGIFKTPRGYAAMVEAMPIKLSYTIYPGEKFFDGQLVAVEENRLVFRKVSKVGPSKFVSSVENKPLKTYTTRSQIEGTAPTENGEKPAQTASTGEPTPPAQPAASPAAAPVKNGKGAKSTKPAANPFLSPLDEMSKQPATADENSSKKSDKKSVKIARKSRQ